MDHQVSRDEFNRLDKQVNGNGQPGIRQKLDVCVSQLDAIRGAQDERARIDEKRFKGQTILLTVFGLILALLTFLEVKRQIHTGELTWPTPPHKSLSAPTEKVYALEKSQPQDATIPPLRGN